MIALREKREKLSQAKLSFAIVQPITKNEQRRIDTLIMNYIISEARPLQTVEEIYFRFMIHGLNPRAVVMGVKKLKALIFKANSEFHEEVKTLMKPSKFVCLAVDMWSSLHRSFMGITAHWINPNSKKRESVAIACRRFIGKYKQIVIDCNDNFIFCFLYSFIQVVKLMTPFLPW